MWWAEAIATIAIISRIARIFGNPILAFLASVAIH
jgi:hypothetical protein